MHRAAILSVFDNVWRSFRYAGRSLSRTPGFTITVVVTLAIAIGANTAMYSVIDNVLLRPLAFPEPERLAYITHRDSLSSLDVAIPPIRLLDWSDSSSAFEAIAAYSANDVMDTSGERPELIRSASVTPDFLEVWGINPAIGRDFREDEHRFGGPSAVLVSDRYWRTRLNSDPAVVGQTLEVDGQALSIVGVMPPSIEAVDRGIDIWTPQWTDAPWAVSRSGGWFDGVVGRLSTSATFDEARQELSLVQSRLANEFPESDDGLSLSVVPYKETVVGTTTTSLWLLFGAVTMLLLIACANLASMLLTRGSGREQDTAIRLSLGASRKAVAFPLLMETMLLVAGGAALGLTIASFAIEAIRTAVPDLPRIDEIAIDARILAYTLASAIVVVLVCGSIPAIMQARRIGASLRRGRDLVVSRHRLHWSLVGVQIALSIALLTGTGLLLRSFDALARVDPGFNVDNILTFRLSGSREAVDEAWVQRVNATLDELTALPGVEAAATSFSFWPGVSEVNQEELEFVDGEVSADSSIVAEWHTVSPSYFATMQIPVLSGEACRQPENEGTQAVVNRSFVERYFPDRSPIGLQLAGDTPERIVGVVGDSRETGMRIASVPTVFVCFSAPTTIPWFLIRTSSEPLSIVESIRARMGEIEPQRVLLDIASLRSRFADFYAEERLRTVLLAFFSASALSLACLGVFGTLSYIVALRRREIGLRLALGAMQLRIVGNMVTRALRIVVLACLAGLGLAFLFTRSLSSMLFEVSPIDPLTLSGVTGLVLLAATAAALLPALRASRLDPMAVLREE